MTLKKVIGMTLLGSYLGIESTQAIIIDNQTGSDLTIVQIILSDGTSPDDNPFPPDIATGQSATINGYIENLPRTRNVQPLIHIKILGTGVGGQFMATCYDLKENQKVIVNPDLTCTALPLTTLAY